MLFSAAYWRDLAERAVSTGAQALVLALGAGSVDALTLDWRMLLGAFLGGAFLSVVKGLAARGLNSSETASLVKTHEPVTTVYGGSTLAPGQRFPGGPAAP